MGRLKKAVAIVLESRIVQAGIVAVILANIAALMLDTVGDYGTRYKDDFYAIEKWSIAVFTIEYLLRMWSCTITREYSRPISGRVRFALTPLMIIDFLATAPFYLAFLGLDLRVLRIIRLIRIFRIGKLARYSEAVQTLGLVLKEKRGELLTALFILLVLIMLSSTLIFYAEHDGQPVVFSSIPASMWWAISTLSTVGYGDAVPATTMGKLIASVISVLGIGMFALPAGILGAAYSEAMMAKKSPVTRCPHCNKRLK